MIRIGIVVQRYGNEVVGGAETLARNVAERLNSGGFDVTVFTTTARDYITWKNEYPAGESVLKGVIVKRFGVEGERNIEKFNAFSETFFDSDPSERDEWKWIHDQGPVCPNLIKALEKEQDRFDLFLFFTYLYYPTVKGLEVIRKPVVLFPTAHDEPPVYLKLMKRVFQRPEALFFLTRAEMEFVAGQFNPQNRMELVRTGVDVVRDRGPDLFRETWMLYTPFMLYAGRIEKGKGLEAVFQAYDEIRQTSLVELVLIGKQLMDIPGIPGIRYLGYISEIEKRLAFKHALVSVQPSSLESLSITTLESFAQKTPVLVNRKSAVLEEHIQLSGGGLSYETVNEFVDQFRRIYRKPALRKRLGEKGYDYLIRSYSWDVVMDKIEKGLMTLISRPVD